jgi:hypothetical protein
MRAAEIQQANDEEELAIRKSRVENEEEARDKALAEYNEDLSEVWDPEREVPHRE